MNDTQTSISQADSPEAIGEFWDTHDLGEVWEQTKDASFSVVKDGSATYFPIEHSLSEKLRQAAQRHGVSAETLLNLWLQESVAREASL